MDAPAVPRLYLVTPPVFEPQAFAATLARVLDGPAGPEVACLRIALAPPADEDAWVAAANHLLPVCHAAEIPLLVTDRASLVDRLGLDGVHVSAGPIGRIRKALGGDRILGASGGQSRHKAMTLAEAGADYVTVSPPGPDLVDLLAWWSEMIETPSVAEDVGPEDAAQFAGLADFLSPHPQVWTGEGEANLAPYLAALHAAAD
ncbi:MAG: thiamine phosphate synthase [Paracoccaceae bacterium]